MSTFWQGKWFSSVSPGAFGSLWLIQDTQATGQMLFRYDGSFMHGAQRTVRVSAETQSTSEYGLPAFKGGVAGVQLEFALAVRTPDTMSGTYTTTGIRDQGTFELFRCTSTVGFPKFTDATPLVAMLNQCVIL